tara:strand:- start:3820 stop:4272 length:453 start_codon:yes stop_codon:yes gene_type:complete
MTITINGSGTVTGVSVGGLPDGIVDTDMLAASAVTSGKTFGGGYTAHAWANITQSGSHAITAGEGFSSISDQGVGQSHLTLSTALSSTDDACVVSNTKIISTGSETFVIVDPSVPGTTTIAVDCRLVDNDAPSMATSDGTHACVIVMTTP